MSEQKVKIKVTHNVVHLPAIALRGLVVFPNNIIHFEVGRAKSIAAIEAAMHGNSSIFLVAQKETDTEEPTAADLYSFGVIAEIKQVLRVSEALLCFPLVCGVICWFDNFLWRLVPVLAALVWFVWTLAAELPYYTSWQGAVAGSAVGALWPFVFCIIGALAASLFKYAFGKTGKEK